tara:strand:+ start:421 stop:738 length:318 start_codon:yes stop_codon:yes gene_type:complete
MATFTEVAEKFNITHKQVTTLRSAMARTWSNCYYDLVDSFEGGEREMYELYGNKEAALVAENTLDADRVTSFCPDMELDWVYELEDGSRRTNVIALGEATWDATN